MKKTFFLALLATLGFFYASGQKYFTREGKISFFSDASLEKIEAINTKATSVLDVSTGKIEFAALIKAFQFEKALMQEHFNENYLESGKYPKASFKGTIADMSKVNLHADGTYPVKVKGQLTLHGVTKDIETNASFNVKGDKVAGTATFHVEVADYNIKIPAVVKDNIAKTVEVKIEANYQLLNQGS